MARPQLELHRPGESAEPAPLAGSWWAAVSTAARSPAARESLAVFLLTRLLFLILTYFGVTLFHNSRFAGAHPSYLHSLLPAWNQWDTLGWYTQIAQRGYEWRNSAGAAPTAFFPLYPILIRGGVLLTHRSYLMVALAIANLSFLGALWYLWRLAAWELNRAVASRTILYIAVFPTALFFFAGYTESLFLLLTVASFYHLRRQHWLLAGALAGLAAATRVTGVLLLVPLAFEFARSNNFSPRRMVGSGLVGLLLAPAGLGAFMLYLYLKVGDALAFSHAQVGWQKLFTPWLPAGFLESLRQIFLVQPAASFFQAHNILEISLGGLFLVWSFYTARRLPAAYTLYLAAFWLVTLANPALQGGYPVPLISLSRYVLSLFPVFMYLGILGARRHFHDAYLVLSTGILALLTVQFVNGGWVV